MSKFGIYKKVSDPVLPETISLVKDFDAKSAAEAAMSKLKDTKDTHYYIAEMKK